MSKQLNEGLFSVKYCPSEEQLADIHTKPLLSVKFEKFRDIMLKR